MQPQNPAYQLSAKEIAAALPPVPDDENFRLGCWLKSDMAMRMALDCGVPIRTDYRFYSQYGVRTPTGYQSSR